MENRYKYIAVTNGGFNKKREVIKLSEINKKCKTIEAYRTWNQFDESYYNYWLENDKSVSDYRGQYYPSFMPIDIDSNDLEKSQKVCREILGLFETEFDVILDSIRIYFSGSKGFHLEVPITLFGDIAPSQDFAKRFKRIAVEFGFREIDTKIYHLNALWRLENTINSKSGLYKIPLTVNEIRKFDINQIKELAKTTRSDFIYPDNSEWDKNTSLCSLLEQSKEANNQNRSDVPVFERYGNNIRIPDFEGVPEGDRNNIAFEIAKQMKSQGYKINEVKDYIINDWNLRNIPPEKDIRSLMRTVESVYNFNVQDSGSIGITRHLRSDPYFNSMKSDQKVIYVYILSHLNEVDKRVWNKYDCKVNQFIYSIKSLAANTSTSEGKVRNLIKKLNEYGRIDVEILKNEKGFPECSILTLNNIEATQ